MAKLNYMNDDEIVEHLKRGAYFEYLYVKILPVFRPWLVDNGGTYEEAKDIFQEWLVYFVLYLRKNPYFILKEEEVEIVKIGVSVKEIRKQTLLAFVVYSLKNRWLNELKKRKEKLNSIDENLPIASSDPDPMQDLVSKELTNERTEKIRKAIAKLNEREQIIIQMFMENCKDKEIAQELDSTAKSIKTQRHRAFEKLKDLVK